MVTLKITNVSWVIYFFNLFIKGIFQNKYVVIFLTFARDLHVSLIKGKKRNRMVIRTKTGLGRY